MPGVHGFTLAGDRDEHGPAAETISVSTKANGLLIPTPPSSLLRNPADHLPILWVLAMRLCCCGCSANKRKHAADAALGPLD